jgi:hypothetical protein
MTVTTSCSTLVYPRPAQGDRGVTWYGTLGLLAATLGLLATVFFGG